MSIIDSRVVEMKFDNAQFEAGVRSTLASLSNLTKNLKMDNIKGPKLDGAVKGLNELSNASKRFTLRDVGTAVDTVATKFSAMQVVGVTALATLAHQAMVAGGNMMKSFTLEPITSGFSEYELKMGSIQTILANTAKYGTKLPTVTAALDELNAYADKTIYNFGDMTKNVGLFTNAGMRVEEATSLIKGFSNEAAASGTSAQGAAGAAYQLSQAMSAGTIRLMDWRSLSNVGMGNSNMKTGLIDIATAMGQFNGKADVAKLVQKDFNGSLEKGWLSSKVMSNYLKIQAGEMSNLEMKTLGLTDTQITAFRKQAKTAEEAATKVRTFTQLVGTVREAVGSGWSETFGILFGDFNEATTLFSGVSKVIGDFVGHSAEARNKVLGDWKALGGRTALITGIKNVFTGLGQVVAPIKEAFRDIFPAQTGKSLYDMTVRFLEFTKNLKIGATTAENLKRTFSGVFAIFSIIGQVLSAAAGMIGRFFGAISQGSGGFLNFTGGIGDFIVSLDKMLERTGILKSFFNGLGDILAVPLKLLGGLGAVIVGLFGGFDASKLSGMADAFDAIGKRLSPLQAFGNKVKSVFMSMAQTVMTLGTKIGGALRNIGSTIADAFAGADFSKTLDIINTGLLGGILLLLKNFFKGGGDLSINVGGGILDSVKGAFDSVTGAMKNMQTNIKADVMMKIAIALGILTASLVALSMVDGEKLAKAMVGLSIGFAGLQFSLLKLSTMVGTMGALKLPLVTGSLLALAVALGLLAVALKIFSTIDIGDTIQGLIAMGGSLLVIAGAMQLMPKGMFGQAVALTVLAVGLNALALAVKQFASLSWDEMAHGLAALAGSLLILAGAMAIMPTNMILQAVALTILAVALNGIAAALLIFSTLSLAEIGTGLLALGGALLVIAGAMALMGGPSLIITSVGLLAVAVSLNVIAGAMMLLGSMSMAEIGKSLLVLAGALLILAGGLTLMIASLPGAAALVVVAGALALLVPVLVALGMVPIGTLVTGLVALAATFAILGVAGLLLAPLAPIILALAASIMMIGAGFALAGAGAFLFATAIGILVAAFGAMVAIVGTALNVIIQMGGQALSGMAQAVISMAATLARGGAAFTAAATTIMGSIIKGISNNIPKIGALFSRLLSIAIQVLSSGIPRVAQAGLQMIIRLLAMINSAIPRIGPLATSIIVRFLGQLTAGIPRIAAAGTNLMISLLNAISKNIPRLADAGAKAIIAFVNAVAGAIRNNSGAMGAAGANVGVAIVQGMARGIAGGLGVVVGAAKRLASSALSAAKAALGIHSPSREFAALGKYSAEGYAKGLDGSKDQINAASTRMRDMLKTAMDESKKDIKAAEDRLRKLRKARHKDKHAIKEQTKALAAARAENKKSTAAYNKYKTFGDEMKQLNLLSDKATAVQKKLDDAKQKYADAVKTRDDFSKSIRDQLVGHVEVDKDTKYGDFVADMQKKIIETQRFATQIQKLRSMGLNDYFYKELLAKGPEALPFIDQVLAKGKNGVTEMNTLGSALDKASKGVGTTAAKNLYQAAVNSAAGLVRGLQSQQKNIEKQMDKIAGYMVNSIKKKLAIRSPSRVFAKIGVWSVEGLAQGLKDSGAADKAAEQVGADAIHSMRKTLSGLSSLVDGGVDMNPTITPVMDLSAIRKGAGQIGSMLPSSAISVGGTYTTAKSASVGYRANQLATTSVGASTPSGANVTFIQNNTSPAALSEATIYRQTRSQIAKAKGALTK